MQNESTQQSQIFWSARLRHPSLGLYRNTVKKQHETSRWCCVLSDKPLKVSNQWFFKMNHINSCEICVGACLQSFAIAGKFEHNINWSTDNNNGQYIITSDGQSFQHKRDNGHTYLWIRTGDVLRVQYDIKQQILVFSKQGKEFKMKVEAPPPGDCYRICLYIYLPNHIVEVIPTGKYKENAA